MHRFGSLTAATNVRSMIRLRISRRLLRTKKPLGLRKNSDLCVPTTRVIADGGIARAKADKNGTRRIERP